MAVAAFLSDDHSLGKSLPRFLDPAELREKLSVLEITGHVARVRLEKFLEMRQGRFIVPQLRTFERQSIASEGIAWFCGDKLFERFAAGFLHLGHSLNPRIIAATAARAKGAGRLSSGDQRRMPKQRNSDAAPRNGTKARAASKLQGKPVSASVSEMTEAVLPNDANTLGTMLGGRVMHLIDIAGALAAHRHSNSHVVTASVDYLDFRFPIRVGEFIVLKSSVNRVFRTSMEVGVKVFSENVLTGERRRPPAAPT